MPRYSPHVLAEITVRVPRGVQAWWDMIRALHREQGDFTLADIDARSNVHKDTIRDYLKRLVRAGYLQLVDPGAPLRRPAIYRLVRTQPDAPRLRRDGAPARDPGRGQEQMWLSMRMVPEFSLRDLQIAGSTDVVSVSYETVKQYVKHLMAAGYLRRTAHGRYALKLSMKTGPLAPQIYRTDFVYDPNTGKVLAPIKSEIPEAIKVRP